MSSNNVLCKPFEHEAEEIVLHKTSAVGRTEILTYCEMFNIRCMALDEQKWGKERFGVLTHQPDIQNGKAGRFSIRAGPSGVSEWVRVRATPILG